MKLIDMVILVFILLIGGCATGKMNPNPILTVNDERWLIPAGTEYQATKKKGDPVIKVTSATDVITVPLGSYLELEKQANSCVKIATP